LMLCVQEVKDEPQEHHLSRFTDDLILRGLGTDYLTLYRNIILRWQLGSRPPRYLCLMLQLFFT
jgi:hypothetical protein